MKKLEILVVEDKPEFIEKANSAYSNNPSVNVRYATTYDKAIKVLEKEEIDGIITDLFFPSDSVSAKEKYSAIGISIGKDPKEGFGSTPRYNGVPVFDKISEEPSGLLIAEYALEKDIHFTILSQGDRHDGDLASVRYYIQYSQFNYKGKDVDDKDNIFELMGRETSFLDLLLNNDGVDKNKEETWVSALDYIKKVEKEVDEQSTPKDEPRFSTGSFRERLKHILGF